MENVELPKYNGEPLYPCGIIETEMCIRTNHSFTAVFHYDNLYNKDERAANATKEIFDKFSFRPSTELELSIYV